jgi:hypothetical protein
VRPLKIVQHQLEKQALAARNKGRTADETAKELTGTLRKRGVKEGLSRTAVERYWASLDEESLPPAHRPQVAEQNAALAVNVAGDLQVLAATVKEWFEEAKTARKYLPTDDGLMDVGADWQARTGASREFREALRFAADVMERVYNIENIRVFQETVLEAVGEASPEVQREIKRRFEGKREIVRAKLLGL